MPLPEGGDLEYRTLPLNWADDKWSDAATENIGRKDEQALVDAVEAGAPTQGRILEQAAQIPIGSLHDTLAGIRDWMAALLALQLALDLRVPDGTASLSKLQRTSLKCEDLLLQCLTRHPQHVATPAPPSAPLKPTLESPPMPTPS